MGQTRWRFRCRCFPGNFFRTKYICPLFRNVCCAVLRYKNRKQTIICSSEYVHYILISFIFFAMLGMLAFKSTSITRWHINISIPEIDQLRNRSDLLIIYLQKKSTINSKKEKLKGNNLFACQHPRTALCYRMAVSRRSKKRCNRDNTCCSCPRRYQKYHCKYS